MQEFAVFAALLGFLFTILWLVIGWRAMKAHEKLAFQMQRFVDHQEAAGRPDFRKENSGQRRLYKQFLMENPGVEQLTSKLRHLRFRAWLITQGHADPGE